MKEYFSHDYNARNDTKLVKVFMKYQLKGIGAYWCIIEMLYEEGGYLLRSEYERISFELRTDLKMIKNIVEDFDLFEKDAKKFWSNTALDRLKKRSEKSVKARESVLKRWAKYERNTNVEQSKNDSNTSKVKKSKEKESKDINKDKEKIRLSKIPNFEEFKNFTLEQEPKIDLKELKQKYESWKINNWKDGNDKDIKNWKSKVLSNLKFWSLTTGKNNYSSGNSAKKPYRNSDTETYTDTI